MAAPEDPNFDAGSMLAVKGDEEQIRQEVAGIDRVTLANWNSKDQVVLAGPTTAMAQTQQVLSEKGYSVIALPAGEYELRLRGVGRKVRVETGKTTFVMIRTGKRTVD